MSAEQREASRLISRLRRRDSSPEFIPSKVEGAQNDIKTQSLRENSIDIKAGTDLVVTGKIDSAPWLSCLTRAGSYKFFVRMRFDPLTNLIDEPALS